MKIDMVENKHKWRKQRPVASGVLAYFPDAILEVAHASYIGQQQHNPDKPLAWDREKSKDQLDAALRHIMDHMRGDVIDDDGGFHLAKAAWRIMAELQLVIEKDDYAVHDNYIGQYEN